MPHIDELLGVATIAAGLIAAAALEPVATGDATQPVVVTVAASTVLIDRTGPNE